MSLILASGASQAQDEVLLERILDRAPDAPPGVTVPPLPEQPRRYETAEGFDIMLEVVVTGLDSPWAMVQLPDETLLVTERNSGRLRLIRDGKLDPDPVPGLPKVRAEGYLGLTDIALHPDFSDNRRVYLTYNKPLDEDSSAAAIARGTWDGDKLVDAEDIFVAPDGVTSATSIGFGPEGFLYLSIYGDGEVAQDLGSLHGKILRLTDTGEVPADNPFVDEPEARPEIYTWGHRTTQGIEVNPMTDELWSVEMGPNGGDEVNVLRPGANYGWPIVSLGRDYAGPWKSEHFQKEGYEDPVIYWMPAISVSGMTFYTGEAFPEWQGDLFVGGLRKGEIPGTGELNRVRFNANGEEIRRESLLADLHRRIRGAFQGKDGNLYVLTEDDNGAVLRIRPAK